MPNSVIARHDPNLPDKNAQNYSKWPKLARKNCSKLLKIAQQVSKGVMCLHIQVRKLSLLGIAVAGVYCCTGLRSVSIAPRSSLLLRSDPSIVNFSWQVSLVIRLAAIASICFNWRPIPQNHHCFDRKNRSCLQFLLFHYCLLVIPQSDINFCFFLRFERYRI